MGGLGSTRWERHQTARTVETCTEIATQRCRERPLSKVLVITPAEGGWMTRCGLDGRDVLFEVTEGEQPMLKVTLSTVGVRLGDGYSQTIAFASMKPNLGGTRWWFRCPLCNRRTAFLYLPPEATGFGCRLCYGLTYESCQRSHVVPSLVKVQAARQRTEQLFNKLKATLDRNDSTDEQPTQER
jgi:hypothetical protein